MRPKLHVALAGSSAPGDAGPQLPAKLVDHCGCVTRVTKHAIGKIAQHPVEAAVVGSLEREQELVVGHDPRFYSDKRSKSTRARAQSAAI